MRTGLHTKSPPMPIDLVKKKGRQKDWQHFPSSTSTFLDFFGQGRLANHSPLKHAGECLQGHIEGIPQRTFFLEHSNPDETTERHKALNSFKFRNQPKKPMENPWKTHGKTIKTHPVHCHRVAARSSEKGRVGLGPQGIKNPCC